MTIKIIKKRTIAIENSDSAVLNVEESKSGYLRLEEKVENNISNWISELREKKQLEFLRTRSFLRGLQELS